MKGKEAVPSLKERIKAHKVTFVIYVLLRLSVILILIAQLINRNFENVFLCILTLLLFFAPSVLSRTLHLELPSALEIIILLFIYAAEILGEIRDFYVIFPYWDTMLHTINGFLAAAIGFSLVDMLNRNKRFTFTLSPIFVAVVAFCFSMTIGVLWEFFEFTMDMFFKLDMQKDTIVNSISTVMLDPSGGTTPVQITDIEDILINGNSLGLGGYLDIGLIDTMKDLIVNFIGAVIFSIFGYFYVKTRGKNKFVESFIPRVKD